MGGITAAAVDGQRQHELMQMPLAHWNRLEQLLKHVARLGIWPDAMLFELDVFIPKTVPSPLLDKQRPISVAAIIYRAWGSARLRQLRGWLMELFKHSPIHGGIPGRDFDGLQAEVAIELAEYQMQKDERRPWQSTTADIVPTGRCYTSMLLLGWFDVAGRF